MRSRIIDTTNIVQNGTGHKTSPRLYYYTHVTTNAVYDEEKLWIRNGQ